MVQMVKSMDRGPFKQCIKTQKENKGLESFNNLDYTMLQFMFFFWNRTRFGCLKTCRPYSAPYYGQIMQKCLSASCFIAFEKNHSFLKIL